MTWAIGVWATLAIVVLLVLGFWISIAIRRKP